MFLHAALLFGTDGVLGGLLWSMAHERIVLASRLRQQLYRHRGLEERAKEEIQRYQDSGSQEHAASTASAAELRARSRPDGEHSSRPASSSLAAFSTPNTATRTRSAASLPQPALAESGEAHDTVGHTAGSWGTSMLSHLSSEAGATPNEGVPPPSAPIHVRRETSEGGLDAAQERHGTTGSSHPTGGGELPGNDTAPVGSGNDGGGGSGSGSGSGSGAEENADALEATELLGILGVTDVREFTTLVHARTSARTAVRASMLFGVLDPASSLLYLLLDVARLQVSEEEYSFGPLPVRSCVTDVRPHRWDPIRALALT